MRKFNVTVFFTVKRNWEKEKLIWNQQETFIVIDITMDTIYPQSVQIFNCLQHDNSYLF